MSITRKYFVNPHYLVLAPPPQPPKIKMLNNTYHTEAILLISVLTKKTSKWSNNNVYKLMVLIRKDMIFFLR